MRPFERTGIITGSMLSDQLYCEVLLDLKLKMNGYKKLRPGEARRILGELLSKIKEVDGKEIKRLAVAGEVEGLYFIISPDAMIIENGSVTTLIRARIRRGLKVYDSDFLLLQIAALLLDRQNLIKDNARLGVIVSENKESLKEALEAIKKRGLEVRNVKEKRWKVVVRIYDPQLALNVLKRLSEYWKGERTPVPSNPFRCRSCPLRDKCEHYGQLVNRRDPFSYDL